MNTGTGVFSRARPPPGTAARSARKKTRKTAYSTATAASQGSAISAANRVKESPAAASASRLVRLETGSSSEAEFARWAVAYTCGRARTPARAAVANTTGVSSTTVASRLRTAVMSAAVTNTPPSRRWALAPHSRATASPAAANRPSSSQSWASTRTAARKPTTGSRSRVCCHASVGETAPSATRSPAAGTAATASGQSRGRTTAKASTPNRRTADTISAVTVLRVGLRATGGHGGEPCATPPHATLRAGHRRTREGPLSSVPRRRPCRRRPPAGCGPRRAGWAAEAGARGPRARWPPRGR